MTKGEQMASWFVGVYGLGFHIHGFFLIILQARRTGNNPQEGFAKFG